MNRNIKINRIGRNVNLAYLPGSTRLPRLPDAITLTYIEYFRAILPIFSQDTEKAFAHLNGSDLSSQLRSKEKVGIEGGNK